MEYVLFVCLMIVPVISIAALILAMLNMKRIDSIKKLVAEVLKRSRAKGGEDALLEDFMTEVI